MANIFDVLQLLISTGAINWSDLVQLQQKGFHNGPLPSCYTIH